MPQAALAFNEGGFSGYAEVRACFGWFHFLFVYKTNLYKARKERKIFAYKRQWKEFLISLPVRLCFPFPCWRRQLPIY